MEVETSNDPSVTNAPPEHSSPARPSTSSNKEQFQVERIVDKRIQNNQKLYLIKWEGFPDSECTWEPVENLLSVLDLIVDYEVRDCIKDPNAEEDEQNNEEDPSEKTKRPADKDLSDEDEPQKKVKTDTDQAQENDNAEDAEDDDEDDEDEDDEEDDEDEEESVAETDEQDDSSVANQNAIHLLRRRKKYLQTLKAFQAEELIDLETFKEFAKKIKMANPFKLETVDYQDLELKFPKYGERIALTDVGLKKRGRPKKVIDPETLAAMQEAALHPKKRGRPSKKLLKLLKKRGRPRKAQDPENPDATVLGESSEPKKRGRPRKVIEGIEGEHIAEGEGEIGEIHHLEGGEESSNTLISEEGYQAKKRGRPKKTLTTEEIPIGMEEEGIPLALEEGQEESHMRRRGRPRKDQVNPLESSDPLGTENLISGLLLQDSNASMANEGIIAFDKSEEFEEEEESEEEERAGDDDYNPLVKSKSKKNATPKQKALDSEHKLPQQEGGQKRGRGRPKKNQQQPQVIEEKKEIINDHKDQMITEESQGVVELNDKVEPQKDDEIIKQENEAATTQPEENPNPNPNPNPNSEHHLPIETTSSEILVKKRGRPPKNKTEVTESQPKRGRGRPPKHAASGHHHHDDGHSEDHHQDSSIHDGEDETLDLSAPIKRKRGRPKKNQEDVDKENEYNENQSSSKDFDFAEKTTERAVSHSPDFNILTQKSDHQQITPEPTAATTSRAMFFKDGNLEAKDKPKCISKVKIVPGSGCMFVVEWEPRANGEQPKTSNVSSNEFKNYNPVFLIDYYENLIRENLKESGQEQLIKSTTEELIPVEPVPEQYGSLAFHDKPKDVISVQAINESGCEFLVRWHERFNSEQPLDSLVNSESFKSHDPSFLIKFYESKLKSKPGNDDAVIVDLPELTEQNKQNETLMEDSFKDMSVFDASNVGIHVSAEFQKDMESSMSNTFTAGDQPDSNS